MTFIFQSLLLVIAGATQKELARQIKYLKVENKILHGKLPKRIVLSTNFGIGFQTKCCELAPTHPVGFLIEKLK